MTVPHLAAVMMMLLSAAAAAATASRNFVWPLQSDRVADTSECRQDRVRESRKREREGERWKEGELHRDSFYLPN